MSIEDYTPEEAAREQLELITKAARRCVYDLKHAVDFIPDSEKYWRDIFRSRSNHWMSVFNPGNDGKNYRHRFHLKISELEDKNEQLIALCKEHNIDVSEFESDLPF